MSPPPPPLCLPFQRQRQKQLTQHPNDSASTATLTSYTSAATKLHFTEDNESYFVPLKEKPKHNRRGSEPTPQSQSPLARSFSSPLKTLSPPIRLWQWGKRWDESVTTLIGDNDHWKLNDTTSDEKVDTTPRLRALRAKMAEEQIDYL